MSSRVRIVNDLDALQVLLHPLRIAILEALREPASAAAVARVIGEPRQKVNYHLKELERAELVAPAGERRSGNFVETLYRAVASSFVVSPHAAWADPRRVEALRSQHSLEQLVNIGERLQRDAITLLDRAAFDGDEIASAAVDAELHFANEADRAAFLREYLDVITELCERYGAREGDPYRVVLAVHPAAEASGEDE